MKSSLYNNWLVYKTNPNTKFGKYLIKICNTPHYDKLFADPFIKTILLKLKFSYDPSKAGIDTMSSDKKHWVFLQYQGDRKDLTAYRNEYHMKIEHKHIWKYTEGSDIRVCEAPIPTIPSCGKVEKTKRR